MRYIGYAVLAIAIIMALSIGGCVLGWFGSAVNVVQQQLDPAELQRKYELFKDEAAQLDKKMADLHIYERRTKAAHCDTVTDRVGREQCMVWLQEQSGIAASYNSLAADYNAQMSKWNYRFCNVGTLPQGATQPLPREFKPYIDGE